MFRKAIQKLPFSNVQSSACHAGLLAVLGVVLGSLLFFEWLFLCFLRCATNKDIPVDCSVSILYFLPISFWFGAFYLYFVFFWGSPPSFFILPSTSPLDPFLVSLILAAIQFIVRQTGSPHNSPGPADIDCNPKDR